jgi:hypothetical protein
LQAFCGHGISRNCHEADKNRFMTDVNAIQERLIDEQACR